MVELKESLTRRWKSYSRSQAWVLKAMDTTGSLNCLA